MKLLKYLITKPAFMFYFAVMAGFTACLLADIHSFIEAPLVVKIGILITVIGGTTGMAVLLKIEYKKNVK